MARIGVQGVRLLGPLVLAVALDAREAEGDAARVAAARLHAVERDLDHELGAHVDGVRRAPLLELQQALGLPGQHLVGQALERLAEHHELPALGVARAEVQVARAGPGAGRAPTRPRGSTRSSVCAGLTLSQPAPRRPASYGAASALTSTPSWPRATRVRRERLRLCGVGRHDPRHAQALGHDRRQRRGALARRGGRRGPRRRRAARRTGASSAPRAFASRRAAAGARRGHLERLGAAVGPAAGSPRRRARARVPAATRATATISGTRPVMSSRLRVKTATSSPSRCTWTRMPSSFHSTRRRAAVPSPAPS